MLSVKKSYAAPLFAARQLATSCGCSTFCSILRISFTKGPVLK
jgi:hypothetical protein